MDAISFTLWVSLFDSLSTTLQIILFTLLLTTEKPIRNALGYLAGLSGAYFACGSLGYLTLDQLRPLLARFIPSNSAPDPVYYLVEFLTGLVMVALGLWYFFRKKKAQHGQLVTLVLSKLKTMNPWFAFGLGLFISITDFPASLPYIAALGKYSSLDLGFAGVFFYILFYNICYALPMVLILGLYLFFRKGAVETNESLEAKVHLLNDHLILWTFAGFGFFLVLDAGCYFAVGHALLKGRFF